MSDSEQPQIYLITPSQFEPSAFVADLSAILDSRDIGCVRLSMATKDEDELARMGDLLRETCHARDVALVIANHFRMVERLGLDGCHLEDGHKQVRDIRKTLGNDGIVGAYCGNSRHNGMTAAETGADYVSFGPVATGNLGDGSVAEPDLFSWWSQMIEVPVVAEGGLTPELVKTLSPLTDFLGIGDEIWSQDDPKQALINLLGT